jgi:hypothetical protein
LLDPSESATLPSPANWARGYRVGMLNLPSTDHPYILTIVVGEEPLGSQAGRVGIGDPVYEGTVSVFVVADTEAEVVLIAHRYAKAIVGILRANRSVAGFKLRHEIPPVNIVADNERHLKAGVYGDSYDADDVDYIRLAEISVSYG